MPGATVAADTDVELLQSGVPRPSTAFFSWECTFPGRKIAIATISLSTAVSEIKGDVGRKSQIFPTPVYFAPH